MVTLLIFLSESIRKAERVKLGTPEPCSPKFYSTQRLSKRATRPIKFDSSIITSLQVVLRIIISFNI
jgi:hypothetical protein